MTDGRGTDFGRQAPIGRVSTVGAALFASRSRVSRSAPTTLLRFPQSPPDQVQVGERSGHLQPVQVLRQAPIADFAEAEDVLDHAEDVLDLGAHPRLGAVLRLLTLVNPAVEAVPAIREVLRVRGPCANDVGLTLMPWSPQTRVSLPCSKYGSASRSWTLAAAMRCRTCCMVARPGCGAIRVTRGRPR